MSRVATNAVLIVAVSLGFLACEAPLLYEEFLPQFYGHCTNCRPPSIQEHQTMSEVFDHMCPEHRSAVQGAFNNDEFAIEDWGEYGESILGQHYPEVHGVQDEEHYTLSKDLDGFDEPGLTEEERDTNVGGRMLHEYLHHSTGCSPDDQDWAICHQAIRDEVEDCVDNYVPAPYFGGDAKAREEV